MIDNLFDIKSRQDPTPLHKFHPRQIINWYILCYESVSVISCLNVPNHSPAFVPPSPQTFRAFVSESFCSPPLSQSFCARHPLPKHVVLLCSALLHVSPVISYSLTSPRSSCPPLPSPILIYRYPLDKYQLRLKSLELSFG